MLRKSNETLKPCPFCDSTVELNGRILICEKGHEFHPNDDDLSDPVRLVEVWNSQPCFNMSPEGKRRVMTERIWEVRE